MTEKIFTLDNWIPDKPTPDDFISPAISVWEYPSKKERELEYYRKWRQENKEKINGRRKKHYQENKEKILEHQTKDYQENKEKYSAYHQKYNQKQKQIVISHYSKNTNQCVCCGLNNIHNLAIDHIEGGGNKHRQQVGAGIGFYIWLIKNDFPEGFQVLCNACNQSKGTGKYCKIHKKNIA